MVRALSYVVVIILALGGGYYLAVSTQAPLPSPAPVATSTPKTVQVTTKEIREEIADHLIDAQYPSFGVVAIDSRIEKIVADSIAGFRELSPNPPGMGPSQNEYTMRFENAYIGPDIISVKLVISEYTGGAHPNSLFSGLNFNRESGKQLLQNDAFRMIGLSASQVSIAATAQLRERLGDTFFAEGANSNPENFSSFLISDDKVTFIFQPYQVAAYAAGPQEVSFERVR